MDVTIDRLSNGLTVYISPDPSQPRVEAWVVIRAGGRHDPASSTGLAHYLEHMMFKGTERLGTLDHGAEKPAVAAIRDLYTQLSQAAPDQRTKILAEIDRLNQELARVAVPNEFDRLYANLGILDLNAYTSQEETAYSADVPAARLGTWAEVEGQRFVSPVFRLFLPELEAVYEEKNISLDDPDERVYDAMMAGLFPQHPYGTQPIIGHAKHLKSPAYADMERFFATYYVPNNAAIMLAGDVERTQILPVLERAFAGWRPKQIPAMRQQPLVGPRGRQELSLVAEGEQSVTLAWRTVEVGHPDELALVALDRLVDHRSRGILHDQLLLPQKLPDAGSSSEILQEGGYWSLYGVARDNQSLAQVEALLRGVVKELRNNPVAPADLAAVKLHAQIDHKLALESRSSRVAHMTAAYATGQQWHAYQSRLERFSALTPADIQRVARRYLGADHVVVLRRDGPYQPPVMPKPQITPVAIDPARESAYAKSVRSTAPAPRPPRFVTLGSDVLQLTSPAGPMFAARNHHSDLFSLVYQFETGLADAPLLCHALDLLDRSGAGELSAISLQKQLHALGSSIKTECGTQEARIVLNGLDQNLEATVDILKQWLVAPNFTEHTLEALLDNTLSQRRDEVASPETVARALSAYAQVGDASYYRLQPTDRELQAATGERLRGELASLAARPCTRLYFGSRDPAKLVHTTQLHSPAHSPRPTTPRSRRYREVLHPTLFFIDKPTAQATIEVLFPTGQLAVDDEPLALALQHLLGNDSSGVVFQELREARGLAYSAYASFELPRHPGDQSSLYAHVGTQAEKTTTALTLLLELLRAPIEAPRFTSTQQSLLEELMTAATPPRDMAYWMHRWLHRGFRGDPRAEQITAIEAMRQDQLQAFAQRLTTIPPIISILGDRKRVKLDSLAQAIDGLEIVELKAEQVFGYEAAD